MKSLYSIISILANPVSGEKIAIGLLVKNENQESFLNFSSSKLNLIKKINPDLFNHARGIAEQLKRTYNENNSLFLDLSKEDIFKLHTYEQGIINYSEPKLLSESINKDKFDYYFSEWIENQKISVKEKNNLVQKTEFQQVLKENLYRPLRNVVNVNYKIEKKIIPDLIFDFKLDVIGANGSLLTVKSIDLNKGRTTVENSIARYELFLDYLIPFSESKLKLKSGHETLLVVNKPVSKSENEELYQKLINTKQNYIDFKVVTSDRVSYVSDVVSQKSVSKFSSLIEK